MIRPLCPPDEPRDARVHGQRGAYVWAPMRAIPDALGLWRHDRATGTHAIVAVLYGPDGARILDAVLDVLTVDPPG